MNSTPTNSPSPQADAGEVVSLEVSGGLAIIRLGSPTERAVILTERRMESLANALKRVQDDRNIRGLVIIAAHPQLFCAGADINVIQGVNDSGHGHRLARSGQKVFELLEKLECKTVCALSGPCVGGGYELALACNYRICTDFARTKIGLPEIKLGILPGFGGTQRLPRLIGIAGAFDVILNGRVLDARRARELGLVDRLVSTADKTEEGAFEELEKTAGEVALGRIELTRPPLVFRDRFLTFTSLGRRIAANQARKRVLSETRGHFPAPLRAIDVILTGLQHGLDSGYHEEAKALGELIVSSESKSLVHLYFLTQASEKLGRAVRLAAADLSVGVVGAGTMGAGIAAALVGSGVAVRLVESVEKIRAQAKRRVEESLSKRKSLSPAEREERLAMLEVGESLEGLAGCGLVIEAIIEDLEEKTELMRELSRIVAEDAVIATNTSSLPVGRLGEAVENPGRFIGMHFFNPAERMPLVEIVRSKETSERAILHTAAVAALLGKNPVVVEDVPGFLVNRILFPYLAEAFRLVTEGASITAVDEAALSFGMPMGPLRLLDEIGLDVAAKVSHIMSQSYPERMAGPNHAEKLVSMDRLGRKNGHGFYRYQQGVAKADQDVKRLLPTAPGSPASDTGLMIDRLIFVILNEAVRCLDEGVAGLPGREAAGQIDLASVMGFGFPAFRGGIIRYGDSIGAKAVEEKLGQLAKRFGDRFKPWTGISERAKQRTSFYDPVNGKKG